MRELGVQCAVLSGAPARFGMTWSFCLTMIHQVSNIAIANISWKYYLVFIVLNAVDFVIITLFFPETKGTKIVSAHTHGAI